MLVQTANFTPILSAVALLLFNGKIAGISGLFAGVHSPAWRGCGIEGLALSHDANRCTRCERFVMLQARAKSAVSTPVRLSNKLP